MGCIDIDEAPTDQACRDIGLTAAVDQHQGARGAQAAQVDVGNALRKGGGLAGVVPDASLADHAVARAQVLEEINRLRRPLFRHLFPPDHRNRIGQVDGGFFKGRTGRFQASRPQYSQSHRYSPQRCAGRTQCRRRCQTTANIKASAEGARKQRILEPCAPLKRGR